MARALKLTIKGRECISLNRQTPEGLEMKQEGEVLICLKSSSEDSVEATSDVPQSPKKMATGNLASRDDSPIKTL